MQVQVDIVLVESEDVVNAIAGEVAKCSINKIVIGASSRRLFSRYQCCFVFSLINKK